MRLSDLTVRNLAPPQSGQKTYYDEALPNFGCRVSQGGTKTFIVRHGNERHLLTLGRYPILTLASARQLAREKLAEFVLGKQRPKAIRWDKALDEYLEHCRQKNRPGTVHEYERLLTRHFNFGSMRIAQLGYQDIERKLKKLEHAPAERNHALKAARERTLSSDVSQLGKGKLFTNEHKAAVESNVQAELNKQGNKRTVQIPKGYITLDRVKQKIRFDITDEMSDDQRRP